MEQRQRWLGIIEILVASACFGFLGIFGKWAFENNLSIGELLTFRFTLAAILLWIYFLLLKPTLIDLRLSQILISAGLGILGYAVFATLYFTAIQGVSVALAALLLYTNPFWVSLINHFRGEQMDRPRWLCMGGALIGLILLLWGQINIHSWIAVLAGLGSALTYAVYLVISGQVQKNIRPMSSSLYVITFAALALYLYHRPSYAVVLNFTPTQGFIVLGIAIISTIIPMTLVLASLQKLKSNETALLSMTEPVTAAIAASLIFHEQLTARQLVGATTVIVCLSLFILAQPTHR